MPHPVLEAQLDAYLDGELTADDARELEAPLVQCPDGAGFRDERIALRAAIAAHVPALQASDALRQRVRAALRVAGGTRSRRRIAAPVVWRSLALAASLAVVAVGSWRLALQRAAGDRKSTRLNSSHSQISYAVFCLKKKTTAVRPRCTIQRERARRPWIE